MEIVYVDSLFLLNLIIDYLLLVMTFRLCALPIRRWRCLIGAIVGGIYSVFCYVPGWEFLGTGTFKLALWLFLSLIAFCREKYLLKCALSFLMISAVFGGGVWAASMWTGLAVGIDLGTLIFSFALCYAFLSLTFSRKMRSEGGQLLELEIFLRGRSVKLTALRDSGNCLREPVSGKAVMAAGIDDLTGLFTPEEAEILSSKDSIAALTKIGRLPDAPRFRPVYYSALGVEAALIPAFTADELKINGVKSADYVIAVSPAPIGVGEYRAVI